MRFGRYGMLLLLLLLPPLGPVACGTQQAAKYGYPSSEELEDATQDEPGQGEGRHKRRGRRGRSERNEDEESGESGGESGESGESGGGGGGGGGGSGSDVQVSFEQLADAVVDQNESGTPRQNLGRLRELVCQGREGDQAIFYRLIVSKHWHYYWLCNETGGRRASSAEGARRVRSWLKSFEQDVESRAERCNSDSNRPVLKGTHESGVRATGYCNGNIDLIFPDGSKKTIGGRGGGRAARNEETESETEPEDRGGAGSDRGGGGSESGGDDSGSCPPCPSGGNRERPRCPPPKQCPACPACPKCDCSKSNLEMGRAAFRQGVMKACVRICGQIYNRCREIDPKTAMCHLLNQYCAENCTK